MAKHAKPYLKCEKRDGDFILTLMAGGPGGHILKGRRTVPADDKVELDFAIRELLGHARGWYTAEEKQADGHS